MLHPSTFKTATGYNWIQLKRRIPSVTAALPTHSHLPQRVERLEYLDWHLCPSWDSWCSSTGWCSKKNLWLRCSFLWKSWWWRDGLPVNLWRRRAKRKLTDPLVFQGQVSHYLLRLPTAPTYENNAAVPTSPNRSHGRTFPQGRMWYQWNMHVRSRAKAKGCYIYTILDSYILSLLENLAFSSIRQIVKSSSCFGSSWTLTCLFSETREMYSRRWNQTPQCWSDAALWRLKLGTDSLSFPMVNLYPHGRRELWELTFAMKCPSGQNIESSYAWDNIWSILTFIQTYIILYHILLFSWSPIFLISELLAQHSCFQASGCP